MRYPNVCFEHIWANSSWMSAPNATWSNYPASSSCWFVSGNAYFGILCYQNPFSSFLHFCHLSFVVIAFRPLWSFCSSLRVSLGFYSGFPIMLLIHRGPWNTGSFAGRGNGLFLHLGSRNLSVTVAARVFDVFPAGLILQGWFICWKRRPYQLLMENTNPYGYSQAGHQKYPSCQYQTWASTNVSTSSGLNHQFDSKFSLSFNDFPAAKPLCRWLSQI